MPKLSIYRCTKIVVGLLFGVFLWTSSYTLSKVNLLPGLSEPQLIKHSIKSNKKNYKELEQPQDIRWTTTTTLKTTTTTEPADLYCVILVWVPEQRQPHSYWPAEGTKLPGRCRVTYFHNQLPKAAIVVVHNSFTDDAFPWKMYRDEDQFFVWWSDSNPSLLWKNYQTKISTFDLSFNWTMTYRRDSDIYFPLWRKASLFTSITTGKRAVDMLLSAKSRSSIWIENDCEPSRANKDRMRYSVQLVQAKMSLSVVGSCFISGGKMPNLQILAKYRFYLSFLDSSGCIDYLTEQLWFPLRIGLVPIVYGPRFEDVVNALPFNSFIHASSFKTAKDLAKYVRYLETNATAYREYFDWRRRGSLETDDRRISSKYPQFHLVRYYVTTGWPRLCEKWRSHKKVNSMSTISIRHFFKDRENPKCLD